MSLVADLVRVSRDGPVLRLTLDSPSNRNALSAELVAQLTNHLQEAAADDQVRVVLIDHTGPAFCAGADLREQLASFEASGRASGVAGLVPLLMAVVTCSKPVVCQVAGATRAGGVGLVAACDIALAGSSATFATSEVRLGVAPAVISVVTVPKIGQTAASRLFLAGEPIGAEEAARIGLISQAVSDQHLAEATARVVRSLLQAHPHGLSATKRILSGEPAHLEERFQAMSRLSAELFGTAAAAEGMQAFFQRRPPAWAPPLDEG